MQGLITRRGMRGLELRCDEDVGRCRKMFQDVGRCFKM